MRVQITIQGIDELKNILDVKQQASVIKRTLTALGGLAKTQIKRAISDNYTIKQSKLNIYVQSFKYGGVFISAKKRPINIIEFKHIQLFQDKSKRSAGILSQMKKGTWEQHKDAFIGRGANNNLLVFRRLSPGRKSKIESISRLSVGMLLKGEWIMGILNRVVAERAQDVFMRNFNAQVMGYIKKFK